MKWYVLLRDWNGYKAGTRLQLSEEDAAKMEEGFLSEAFETQQEAMDWKAPKEGDSQGDDPIKPAQAIDPEAIAAERDRVIGIQQSGKALGIEEEHITKAIEDGVSVETARARFAVVLEQKTPVVRNSSHPAVPAGTNQSQHDKFAEVAGDALTLKLFTGATVQAGPSVVQHFRLGDDGASMVPRQTQYDWTEGRQISQEARQWSGRTTWQLASQALEQSGVRQPWYLSPRTIAELALSSPASRPELWGQYGVPAMSMGTGYHTPSHFPNLLRDAINKRARAGFEIAPTTYQIWARQAPSVSDFKTIHRPILSEAQDLDEITGNMSQFPEAYFRDLDRTYRVARYGKRWSLTVETIVNDDMNSLSVLPQRHMIGARATLNRFIYGFFTTNASFDSGNGSGNLFNSTALTSSGGHNNDLGAGAPAVAVLNTAWEQMMTQRALHPDGAVAGTLSDQILNIGFRWMIVPAALRGTTLELLRSTANPGVGGDTTGSSGVANIWQGGFELVVDGNLDSDSTAAYYFAADPSLVDTVEYTFLSGFENPRIETEFDFETKGQKATIEWDFGGQVIDHRGLVRAGV